MLPSLRKFVTLAKENKTEPKSTNYTLFKEFITDPLFGPKLAFFKTLASDVELFLREFQSDWPLAPFLHSALNSLPQSVMERFIKPECIKPLVDVIKDANLLPFGEIEIGFETSKEFRQSKSLSQQQFATFRQNCRKGLKKFVLKLMDRSPLKYKLTEAVSSLDPSIAVQNVGKQRFKTLLQILNDSNWIDCTCSDKAFRQFTKLCSSPSVIESCNKFRSLKERVDHFWVKQITNLEEDFSSFRIAMETVLILSHGNANVERGFSINKESVFENMSQETLVAHRGVYDAVIANGGVDKVPITSFLIHAVRNAHSKYQEAGRKKYQGKSIR